jgi:2-iminobutanoate/2-iminopropanoate deaminase
MKYVQTNEAPAAVGPYSQAIVSNGMIFCSGQIGLDATGMLAQGIEAQVQQIMTNIKAVLHAEGSDLGHVVKTTIYLTDIAQFAVVNDLYARYFSVHQPARSTVGVAALPKGALIEIEVVAEVVQ